MRRTTIPLALLALAIALPAAAQLSQQYAGWPSSAVSVLLTDEEKAEFSRLTSDAEAEAFIEIFWARRDPNQKTSFNEKTMPWFIASIVLGGGGIFALVSAAKVATKTGPPER